jgi:hypothetical protein
MKTTLDIPDDLFREAKVRAAEKGITLKELMTEGLRLALSMKTEAIAPHFVTFPLIKSKRTDSQVTSDDVRRALNDLDAEEDDKHVNPLRH